MARNFFLDMCTSTLIGHFWRKTTLPLFAKESCFSKTILPLYLLFSNTILIFIRHFWVWYFRLQFDTVNIYPEIQWLFPVVVLCFFVLVPPCMYFPGLLNPFLQIHSGHIMCFIIPNLFFKIWTPFPRGLLVSFCSGAPYCNGLWLSIPGCVCAVRKRVHDLGCLKGAQLSIHNAANF